MSNTRKKVSIEIGHGGGDPGAVRGNIREKDINLVVGSELRRQLERHGVEVLVSRTTDVGFRVADFLARARSFNPDAGISVHTNAFNGTARGFEVFRNTNAFRTTSSLLCAGIEREVKRLGQTSRGIKDSPFMMSSLNCPTAYCELGFLDNSDDYRQFDTADKQRRFACAYARGILEYFGITWRAETVSPPAPVASAPAGTVNPQSQTLYRVVAGSFSNRSNAIAHMNKLKSRGFDAFITEHKT
jgi:N-acetylmuramoyl-L-alanine amidase